MDLEVEVRDAAVGVPRAPDEPEHVACLDGPSRDGERRVRAEVRVVELVPRGVAEPEAPAADVVPADREERPVRDGEDGGAGRRDEVLAVVPLARDVGPEGAERVAERRRAEQREHVPAVAESRGDLRRRLHQFRRDAGDRATGLARGRRRRAGRGPRPRRRPLTGKLLSGRRSPSRGRSAAVRRARSSAGRPVRNRRGGRRHRDSLGRRRADDDLGAGRKAVVLRDQPQPKAGDRARARARRPRCGGARRDEHVERPPVGQRKLHARGRAHGLPERHEPGDLRRADVRGRPRDAGGGARADRDRVGDDLAAEDDDLRDVGERLRDRGSARLRGHARGGQADADQRAVLGHQHVAAAHLRAARQEHAERAAAGIGGVEAAFLAHVPVELDGGGALDQYGRKALALGDQFGGLDHGDSLLQRANVHCVPGAQPWAARLFTAYGS